MGLFSATAPVVAILDGDMFLGQAKGYMDRTGTLELQSGTRDQVKCIGEFRYTGSRTGAGQVTCSDGVMSEFQFTALSALSGYGYGRSSQGPFSFTFGLTAEQSTQYLTVPTGKRIDIRDKAPRLIET